MPLRNSRGFIFEETIWILEGCQKGLINSFSSISRIYPAISTPHQKIQDAFRGSCADAS